MTGDVLKTQKHKKTKTKFKSNLIESNCISTCTEETIELKHKKNRHLLLESDHKKKAMKNIPDETNEISQKQKHKRKFKGISFETNDGTELIENTLIQTEIATKKHKKKKHLNDIISLETSYEIIPQQTKIATKKRKKTKHEIVSDLLESNHKIKDIEHITDEVEVATQKPVHKKRNKHGDKSGSLKPNSEIENSQRSGHVEKKKKKTNSSEVIDETEFNGQHDDTTNLNKVKHRNKRHILESSEYITDEADTLAEKQKQKKSEEGITETNKEITKKRKKEKVKKEKNKPEIKVKDCALLQKKGLEYLNQWHTERANWKFEKLRQIWLLESLFDSSKVPGPLFPVLIEYLSGGKGNTRKVIQERCLKVIASMERWMEMSEQGLGDAEILAKAPDLQRVEQEEYRRARSLLQSLEDENTIS